MDNFTDSAVQGEIINLTNVISTSLPVLEGISQSNLDALTASSAVSQAIAAWNLPAQIESLNANIITSSELQGTIIATSFETQGAASASQNDSLISAMGNLFEYTNGNLLSSSEGLKINASDGATKLLAGLSGMQENSDDKHAKKLEEVIAVLNGSADGIYKWLNSDQLFFDDLAKRTFGDFSNALNVLQGYLGSSING